MYSSNEYQEIRMKSKTYAACSLKDKQNKVIGILVAESLDENWQVSNIKQKLEKQAKYYSEIYITLKDYIENKVNNENGGSIPW